MEKKLFFGNISYDTTDADLQKACAEFGTVVSAEIVIDRATNRAKGFGFVTMSTEEEAQAVIDALNEKDFMGRKIFVNEARPKEDRPRR